MKPKLRFKEFNSDWNTYKFYELVTIKNGQVDPNDEQYRNLPHIGPGNIEKETGRLLEYNLAKDDKLVSSKYLFDKESVIYGKINPHFAKVCYPKFVGLCSADAYPINPIKGKLTSEFLLYLLLNPQFTKFATSVSMRTGMPKINRDELSIYKFTIPEIAEQNKIGNMLTLLDKKIELQTKKIEDLKLFKSYTKNKLFQSGDKTIKLGDILTKWNKKNKAGLINYVESISN
ncbi:MAG: restriction endonuclease subunit S, partial [Bacilli bacterium]|nr:restriction endonuclease subunit S [Bacilli bacterium]